MRRNQQNVAPSAAPTRSGLGSIACAVAFAAAGTDVVLAQTPTIGPEPAQSPQIATVSPQEVVVTGTRLGTSGFSSPTPVTAISPLEFQMKAATTMVDVMYDIPSLTPNQTTNSSVDVGASNFNLRNLGPTRTLVLVDGVRVEPTSVNGGFDINTIPTSLVKSMDIVTGGASAAYGSDAVAGVVNIALDTQLNGFRSNVDYGESQYGDSKTYNGSFAYGSSFASGSGHFVVAADYFTNDGVAGQDNRPWGKTLVGLVNNPSCPTQTTPGCYQNLILPNTVNSKISDGGVIVSPGPLQNIQFGPGGVPEPFRLGTNVGATFMTGGDGSQLGNFAFLSPAVDRKVAFAHASYDISENLSFWSEFRFARTTEHYYVIPNYDNGDIVITQQNAFLPPSIKAIMVADNIPSVMMGRANYDLGTFDDGFNVLYGLNNDFQGSAGVKGKFDLFRTTWSWDAVGQYSSNEFYTTLGQNRIAQNWLNSIDSLISPTTGQPICRVTLTNPNSGCVPVNLFGPNTITQAVRNYTTGTSYVDAMLTQALADLNFRGTPFTLWAGPLSMAFGGEFRRQTTDSTSDPISQESGWRAANAIPYSGAVNVDEGYFETDIPLAKDLPLIKAFDFNGAVRITNYSTSGLVDTWKVGANWSPTEEVRLRFTRSRDIRAPDLTELYQAGVLRTGGTITNPLTGVQSTISTLTSGNPNLVPEIGDTITTGVIYSPHWAPGANLSLDYWNIRLSGALGTVTPQQVVNNCFSGLTNYCSSIGYDSSNGLINYVASTEFNEQSFKTSGFDMEASEQFNLADLFPSLSGKVMLRALGTYVLHVINDNQGIILDSVGCVGVCDDPQLRIDLNGIYLKDPWIVSVTANWMGGGDYNTLYNSGTPAAEGGGSINDNHISGRLTVNTTVAYNISTAWQIYGKIENLFNVFPPYTPSTTLEPNAAFSTLYDRIGRTFTIGFKTDFE